MKKIITLTILMIMILLIGCKKETSTSDTPPPFGAPPVEKMMRGAFTGTVPTGFGVPVDVFNGDLPIIQEIPKLSADPSDTNIPTVSVKVDQAGGWIWNEGARYDWSTGTWVKFTFPQPTYGTTKWIRGSASIDLKDVNAVPFNSICGPGIKDCPPKDPNDPAKTPDSEGNLIVAFSCKRYSGEWRCGCSSTTETGACAKWMARKYGVSIELPPVTDPGMPPNLFEAPAVTATPPPVPTVDLATKQVVDGGACPAGKVACGMKNSAPSTLDMIHCCTTKEFTIGTEQTQLDGTSGPLLCGTNQAVCGGTNNPGDQSQLDMLHCCSVQGATVSSTYSTKDGTAQSEDIFCQNDEVVCGATHSSASSLDFVLCCKLTK